MSFETSVFYYGRIQKNNLFVDKIQKKEEGLDMHNKKISTGLIATLAIATLITGCAKNPETPKESETIKESENASESVSETTIEDTAFNTEAEAETTISTTTEDTTTNEDVTEPASTQPPAETSKPTTDTPKETSKPTTEDPVNPVVHVNGFDPTEFLSTIGDDLSDVKALITDMSPIDSSTINKRFASSDEGDAVVAQYVWEYTDGQIGDLFDFLSSLSDLNKIDFMKSFYSSNSPSLSDYNTIGEDGIVLACSAEGAMLGQCDFILYYPYFLYDSMYNNRESLSFSSMLLKIEELYTGDIPTFKYMKLNHSEIVGKVPFYKELFDGLKIYNSTEDPSSHKFRFGAPAEASGEFVKNLPSGEVAAYVVPIKDVTKGVTMGCVFNKENKVIKIAFL